MPNLRELLTRAAPEPSADWDAAGVARRGRTLRRRRRAAVGAGGLGVLVALALLVPAGLDQRDTEVRIGPADEDESIDESVADRPMVPVPGPREPVIWPFERPEMVLLGSEGADAGDLDELAAELEAHDDVAEARRLDAADVAARVGTAQADRVLGDGAGAVVIDVPGGAAAREAAHDILPLPEPERMRRPADPATANPSAPGDPDEASGPDGNPRPDREPTAEQQAASRYGDARIGELILPDCEALAHSAALVGVDQARGLLEDAGCHDEVRIVAAGPDASEPWVATAPVPPDPAALEEPSESDADDADTTVEGSGTATGESAEATTAEPEPGPAGPEPGEPDAPGQVPEPLPTDPDIRGHCVQVLTVRAEPPSGCAHDREAIDGLSGTRWDRDRPVLAGIAPEGTVRVTAAGAALAVDDAGQVPMFAGAITPDGEAVTVRAFDADGQLLDERAVTAADVVEPERTGPGPSEPRPRVGAASWPFTSVTEAVVTLDPDVADETVANTADELAAEESIVEVERLTRAEAARRFGDLAPPPLRPPDAPDAGPAPAVLRVIAEDTQAARSLAGLDQRHEIDRAITPTCPALVGAAMFHGIDHAETLLAEAGCDGPTFLGAGDDPPWLAAATITDDDRVCVADMRGLGRASGSCGTPPPADALETHTSELDQAAGRLLVSGLAPAAATTVEVELAGDTATSETVAVTDTLTGFAVPVEGADREDTALVRALDADGNVLAERETELDRHGSSKVLEAPGSASHPDAEPDREEASS